MKKDDYLNKLSQGLKQYDVAYVDEILQDYEEHFQDALANGKSEEDICASLGDPDELIAEIKAMMDTSSPIEAPARPVLDMETSKISDSGQAGRNTDKDIFHANFANDEQHTQNQQAFGVLKKIHFFADSADVRLIPSSDGEFHIYTEDAEDMEYIEHFYNNDTYEGRVLRTSPQSSIALGIIHGILGSPVGEVIMEIPADMEDVRIESYSGDISADGIHSDILSLAALSGDCSIKHSKNNGLFISSKSGDVKLDQVDSGYCEIKTLSGDIRCKELSAQKLTVNTISGDVSSRRLNVQLAQIKTTSGEISLKLLKNCDTYYATAKTVSGHVKIRDGIRIDAMTFQTQPQDGKVKLALQTVSGEISVKFSKNTDTQN